MKPASIVLLLFVCFLPAATRADSLTIDRVWSEAGYGYALVTYKNNSTKTYAGKVTVQCVALDAQGKKINTNTRSFFAFDHGPISPGFEGTVKVPVKLHGKKMKSMNCACRGQ